MNAMLANHSLRIYTKSDCLQAEVILVYNLGMPDNTSPEKSGVPTPSSVEFMRSLGEVTKLPANEASLQVARSEFKPTSISEIPGAEEQLKAAQEEFNPEDKGYVPDIRMQLSGEQDDRNIMDLIRAMTGRAATSGLEKFSNGLQEGINVKRKTEEIENNWKERAPLPGEYDLWEKSREKEKEMMEKLSEKYNRMVEQQIEVVNDIFRISIDQKKNAYPYDHRTAELTVRTVVETAQALQKEEWATDPEAQIWLQRTEEDASWMADLLQVTVAESAMAPYNFDVMMQIQVLKEHYKATVTSDNLVGLNAKDVPGFEFDDTQETLINKEKIGLAIPDIYKKHNFKDKDGKEHEAVVDLVKDGKVLGLRELGVKMRDESFAARMKMAAVSQADFTATKPEGTTFMGDNLKHDEYIFYKRLLLVNEEKKQGNFEGHILAPHMVSKDGDKRKITAILEAMLVTNATERLNDISEGKLGDYENKASAIQGLVDDVIFIAKDRSKKWRTRGKDVVSNLAVLTTRQGLYEDFALLNVYRYCWQFVWNTDKEGEIISKKKVDTAGIYSYSGDAYSLYYMKRAAQYDRTGNSRTPFLLPTSKGGRTELDTLPYDKMPHFDPKENCLDKGNRPIRPDPFLLQQWNLLFGEDSASIAARKALGYDGIHPEIAKTLREWATKWRTPYSSKYVESGNGDYELVVPHFMPSGLDIANFYEAIKLGGTDSEGRKKTAWQELIEGSKLSQINWGKLDNLPFDRWNVDLDMASRYMKVLIEVFDKEKDPFYSLVVGSPGTLGPKELAKRLRLSFRDSDKGVPEEYEVAMIPFFVTMACADKYGIMSASAWQQVGRTDIDTNTVGVERFLLEMASWKKAFKWLPSDRPRDTEDGKFLYYYDKNGNEIEWNYGNTMALIAEFYESVLLRVGKSSAEESFKLSKDNYNKTVARVNQMPFIGNGILNHKMNDKLIPN